MFLKAKVTVLFFVLFSLTIACGDAMCGLKWCISPQDLKSMGIKLTKKITLNNLFTYVTDSLPKNVSDAEHYVLIFDGDSSLIKIVMYSKTITHDLWGAQGKKVFDKYSQMLEKTYKQTSSYCSIGNKVYKNNDEFYQCLQYEGCGEWISFFKGENKSIQIELRGLDRGKGYLAVSEEADPEFSNALNYRARNRSNKDSVGW